MSRRLLVIAALALASSGCPRKTLLPPPPRVLQGPAAEALARRDALIRSVRASAVIRSRLPPGMPGVPGKLHAVVLSAATPDRARLEVLTPLGTPGATVLIAGGLFQIYQPFSNELLRAPIDSRQLAEEAPFPIPMRSLPAMLRGSVPLADGDLRESKVMATASSGAATLLEITRLGTLVERVTVDADGGYPVEDVRYENGAPVLTVRYLDYGAVATSSGSVAFPQKVTAQSVRPEGLATVEVSLSRVEIDPALQADAFMLDLGSPGPRIREMP